METFSDRTGIRGAVESKIGDRSENQDSYGMSETPLGMLVVVCDGMGGGPAGKLASSIATQAIIDYVSGSPVDKNPVSVLEDAGVAANEAVLAAVTENPALKGMGTTCVCVLVRGGSAYVMHIGDSRCYQLRAGKYVFRTADHSYVGELVRRGTMSEEDARNSKYSNVITRAIGAGTEVVPEVDEVFTKPGDRFALMSDGIWGSMPEPQLVVLLSSDETPADLVVDVAERVDAIGVNHGGGHDNLTLAVVDLPSDQVKKPATSVNDRFAELRGPGSSVAGKRPVPDSAVNAQQPSDSGSYKLEPIEDKPESDSKKKNVLIWALAALLVVAVALISYLIIAGGSDDEKSSSDNLSDKELVADSREKVNGDKKGSPDYENDNQSDTRNAESAGGANSGNGMIIENVNKIKGSAGNSDKVEDNSKDPVDAPSVKELKEFNASLDNLLESLDALLEFNKKEKLRDKNEIRRRRVNLFKDVQTWITRALSQAPDNASKTELNKINDQLKDKNVREDMLRVDTNHYHTILEGTVIIKDFKNRISKLKKK